MPNFPAQGSIFCKQINKVANNANTDQDVKNRKKFAGISFGHKIAESDASQSYGGKVKRIQPPEMLNHMIEDGSAAQHKKC
jgi:hypothetical protein